jgi:hypothetical protein
MHEVSSSIAYGEKKGEEIRKEGVASVGVQRASSSFCPYPFEMVGSHHLYYWSEVTKVMGSRPTCVVGSWHFISTTGPGMLEPYPRCCIFKTYSHLVLHV